MPWKGMSMLLSFLKFEVISYVLKKTDHESQRGVQMRTNEKQPFSLPK
jgi:hypothetical protein